MKRALLLFLGLLGGAAPGSAAAAELASFADFPGAVETYAQERALDSYRIPIGRFTETFQPVRTLEGLVRERVLRLDDAELSSLEALRDVEALLLTQGFTRVFDCAEDSCGGFDFRFNTRVIPAPKMEVDLADFRYLATVRDGAEIRDHVSVLVSRVGSKLFVQFISVETPIAPAERAAAAQLPDRLRHRFEEDGRSVLDDVAFVSGASELSAGSDGMLEALATVMAEAPELNIAIVGHTDNEGDAALNQKLSEARAQAVVARLIEQFGVPAERLSAHGVGFLAPLTSNATAEGRRDNRRVEAVIK